MLLRVVAQSLKPVKLFSQQLPTFLLFRDRRSVEQQDAVGAYIWAWLFLAYVKFVMCMRDMWVVQWYCVFEGLVEMCEVVGMELYWKLIAKMVGLVCEVVTGFLRGCFYWMLVIESNSVNSGTEVLIENVCIK